MGRPTPAVLFLQPENSGKTLDALAWVPFVPTAIDRLGGVLRVDESHQVQVLLGLGGRLVVEAGAGQAQQFALPADAQFRMADLDQRPLGLNRGRQIFFSPSPAPFGAGRSARRAGLVAPRGPW